jgi:hypothetical protein
VHLKKFKFLTMKTTCKFLLTIALCFCVLSCGTVRDHRVISQPQNKTLSASVGSTLLRVNKKSDLPNAFGGRDIYGGKVDNGYSEVKLLSIKNQRYLKLWVNDVYAGSSETTMDRYGRKSLVDINQNIVIGSQGSGGVGVEVDTLSDRSYTLSGVKIEFLKVGGSSVDYIIRDTN